MSLLNVARHGLRGLANLIGCWFVRNPTRFEGSVAGVLLQFDGNSMLHRLALVLKDSPAPPPQGKCPCNPTSLLRPMLICVSVLASLRYGCLDLWDAHSRVQVEFKRLMLIRRLVCLAILEFVRFWVRRIKFGLELRLKNGFAFEFGTRLLSVHVWGLAQIHCESWD